MKSEALWNWEQKAGQWIDIVESGTSRYQLATEHMIKALKIYRPMRVCDLGCGEGNLTRKLDKCLFEVVGVDGTLRLLSYANQTSQLKFLCKSYEDIVDDGELPGGKYDTAVFNFSLDETSQTKILSTVKECLVGTKTILIQTIHPFFLYATDAKPKYSSHWREDYLRVLTGKKLAQDHSWYARTLEGWLHTFKKRGLRVIDMMEGAEHKDQSIPFSMIFVLSGR